VNWEDSRSLTPLKRDFLKAFFARERRFFLTGHEIMVNKIATLISRCELKDLVDLYFLEKEGYRIERHFEEAQRKDGGLDPGMVSLLLDSLAITELPDYMLRPLTVGDLRTFVDDLKRRMAIMAYPA
jgi:hypothetical protein